MKQKAQIKMIKKTPCPYCDRALTFFKNKGVEVEVTDLTNDIDKLMEYRNQTGHQTVPMIFIGEKFVGGYDDLKALDADGGFDPLVFG
ncbi:MAG: glutathione S-transferase N-terminal domain-containing protein [Bdellovibrionaceae bacterium]|nr:glutathione S-transferase N-terminal domain-containing protein [Pseudobdellovibrionaceae bacterium]